MEMKKNDKVSEYIDSSPEDQRKILEKLRKIIHQTIPETKEEIKWQMPVFSNQKIFTYLRRAKDDVAIGFYNIDKIDDPDQLLEGTGKTMRHIKVNRIEEINEDLIKRWIQSTII